MLNLTSLRKMQEGNLLKKPIPCGKVDSPLGELGSKLRRYNCRKISEMVPHMTYREIGEVMGVPVTAIHHLARRGEILTRTDCRWERKNG